MGKTARPKYRRVCHTCSLWLLAEQAANIIEVEFESDNEDSVDLGGGPPADQEWRRRRLLLRKFRRCPVFRKCYCFKTRETLACNYTLLVTGKHVQLPKACRGRGRNVRQTRLSGSPEGLR